MPECGLSELERIKLQEFFERHGLFLKEGVALNDVLEMTDTGMRGIVIGAFSHTKHLLKVIEEHRASRNTSSISQEQVQETRLPPWVRVKELDKDV